MFSQLSQFHSPWFRDFDRLFRFMDEAMSDPGFSDIRSAPRGTFPAINVGETEDTVHLYAFAPGVSKDDIELNVEDGVLFIRGRRSSDETAEGRTYYRRERFSGAFARAVRLPDYVDPEQVEAHLDNGVLTVRLRKREESRPRKIEIKAD
ncbi:MAG: Hsp20/alpha crystallin family protein [Ectothiorhodospiraceae bacterium]|nr:Hsp20/alpha crystallin family protein [Ectothiorhodospiraceae bacterium]MCH8504031.1 Hsp20/alpha crystallin family protein [Ectothiorhodospiraceae bacterium]